MMSRNQVIHGIIVKRRCIGRNLAFAEVDITDSSNDGSFANGTETVNFKFNRRSFQPPEDDVNNDLDDCVQLNDPFPTKKSSLPYGAKVTMQLRSCISADVKGGNVDGSTWEVVRWKIVQHPKEIAEQLAALNFSTSLSHITPNGDTSEVASIILGSGALSCSTYLRIRRNQFDKVNKEKVNRFKKKKHNSTDVLTVNNQMVGASKSTINEEFCHGGKQAKARRAKVFAAWVLETFVRVPNMTNKTYCEFCSTSENNEHFLQNASSTVQNFHALDIAGGKGHLSLELILQQYSNGLHSSAKKRIPSHVSKCTIIDPVVRKGDAKMRQSKLQKARYNLQCRSGVTMPSENGYSTQTDSANYIEKEEFTGQEISHHTITHLASCFTADTFQTLQKGLIDSCSSEANPSEESYEPTLILLGLHPDQCTEDIVDAALKHNLQFAIVPCCVYPDLFPTRQYWVEGDCAIEDGNCKTGNLLPVRTHGDFLKYLMQKDEKIQMTTLPFEGKNVVLYKVASKHACLGSGNKVGT